MIASQVILRETTELGEMYATRWLFLLMFASFNDPKKILASSDAFKMRYHQFRYFDIQNNYIYFLLFWDVSEFVHKSALVSLMLEETMADNYQRLS